MCEMRSAAMGWSPKTRTQTLRPVERSKRLSGTSYIISCIVVDVFDQRLIKSKSLCDKMHVHVSLFVASFALPLFVPIFQPFPTLCLSLCHSA